jgi:hypothetical protein
VFSKTPHPVVLAWMKNCLELWSFRGHNLDRAMIELVKAN